VVNLIDGEIRDGEPLATEPGGGGAV
jgi:hypothetical protein